MNVLAHILDRNHNTQNSLIKNAFLVACIYVFLIIFFMVSMMTLTSLKLNLCEKVPIAGCDNLLSTISYSIAIVFVQIFLNGLFFFSGKAGIIEIIPGIWHSRKKHGLLLLGIGITLLAFLVATIIETAQPVPWIHITWVFYSSEHLPDVWIPVFTWLTIFAAAFWEELLFRGYSMQFLQNKQQEWIGGLLASLLFAVFHDSATSIPNFLTFLIFGLTMFYCYYVTRSIWLSVGIHFCWNLVLNMQASGNIFWQVDSLYPSWWTSLFGENIKLPFLCLIGIVLLMTRLWARLFTDKTLDIQ